jgi:hypothetical protein
MRLVIHDFDFPRQLVRPASSNLQLQLQCPQRTVDVLISDEKPVEIVFKSESTGNFSLVIGESCCQDVLSSLGAPTKMYTKQREPIGTKARRHNEALMVDGTDDYFFNYVELGIDVLFEGAKHILKKVILRTNLLGHPTFGQYDKCSFTVKFVEKAPLSTPGAKKPSASMFPSSSTALKNGKKGATQHSFEDLLTSSNPSITKTAVQERLVSCDDHWLVIAKKLDLIEEKPMVHERAEQPFGPCHLFGYRRSVFEVDKASQYLSSLTVF